MKVKVLTAFAGPPEVGPDGSYVSPGLLWQPGDVVEVDNATAERMIAAGLAEPVGVETPEAAAETRVAKRKR